MSDPKAREHTPASTAAPQETTSQPEYAPVASPSPEQVNRLLASSSRIGAPAMVDLGDQDTGERSRHPVHVANLDHDKLAVLHVELEGPSSLVLANAPAQLRPSHDGFDSRQMIDIAFEPKAKGRVTGRLHISMQWPDGSHEEKIIEVRGAAHAFDQPTLDQEDAARTQASDHEREAAEHTRAEAALDTQIHDQERASDLRVGQGPILALEARRGALEAAWKDLYSRRAVAVSTVAIEMGKFRRKATVKDDSSLAVELALAALDVVTAGISGAIARGVEAAVGDDVPRVLTALLSNGVKQGVKKGGDAVHDRAASAIKPVPADTKLNASESVISQDPQAAFFATEVSAVDGDDSNQLSNRVAQRAADALIPLLRTKPTHALALMEAATTAVGTNAKPAREQQLTSTRSHWLQYLAHTNGGTAEDEQGQVVTNAERLLSPATKRNGVDGVIDVRFRANLARAEQPVEIVGLRLNGVAKGFAQSVFDEKLAAQAVPIRALGQASSTNATLPITVVRDEGGSIHFEENTAPAGQPSDWLSRHAGDLHPSPGGELRGAHKVLDEISNASLKGITVENDDDAKS